MGIKMNYRHAYHAGGFSDVFKHIVLIGLLQSLLQKATPFCYLDTHGGAGCYDLFTENAQKSKEFEEGIHKILCAKNPPDLVKTYLECINAIHNQLSHSLAPSLRYYPG